MISRGQMYRQMYMGGGQGIMSLDAGAPSIKYTGDIRPEFSYGDEMRQQYGLGSIVKKAVKGVTNVVKDVVKSDLGKAALAGAALYYGGGGNLFGLQRAGMSGFRMANLPGIGGLFSQSGAAPFSFRAAQDLGISQATGPFANLSRFLPKTALGRTGAIAAIGGLTGFLSSQGKSEEEIEAIKRDPQQLSGYLRQYFTNLNPRASEKQISDFVQTNLGEYQYAVGGRVGYSEGSEDKEDLMERVKKIIEEIESKPQVKETPKKETKMQKMTREDLERRHMQDITRSMKAEGDIAKMAAGIEGLPFRRNSEGVGEVDLRETGGFIPPVGVKEKADDIPAMLSNNEFVFTADAVRGMGNGDVNLGAQRMYDMMKKLENGGRV